MLYMAMVIILLILINIKVGKMLAEARRVQAERDRALGFIKDSGREGDFTRWCAGHV